MKKTLFSVVLSIFILLNTTTFVFAVPDSENSVTCNNGSGINTAIGCVPALTSSSELMSFILTWAIGVGGGIAFLLIVYAGFQIMTSQGDPQRLKGGQELLTAAISGIVMLIFSVFILRLIGVNILGIF